MTLKLQKSNGEGFETDSRQQQRLCDCFEIKTNSHFYEHLQNCSGTRTRPCELRKEIKNPKHLNTRQLWLTTIFDYLKRQLIIRHGINLYLR